MFVLIFSENIHYLVPSPAKFPLVCPCLIVKYSSIKCGDFSNTYSFNITRLAIEGGLQVFFLWCQTNAFFFVDCWSGREGSPSFEPWIYKQLSGRNKSTSFRSRLIRNQQWEVSRFLSHWLVDTLRGLWNISIVTWTPVCRTCIW